MGITLTTKIYNALVSQLIWSKENFQIKSERPLAKSIQNTTDSVYL